MKLHANARLRLKGRELLVERIDVLEWSALPAQHYLAGRVWAQP
jgi:hypothetical protein